MARRKHSHSKAFRDLFLVVLSIIFAYFLLRVGVLENIVSATEEVRFIGSFLAGLFFTSAFTIAPAAIALAKISETSSPFIVALWGAVGAMIGDTLLFLFLRDSVAEDFYDLVKGPKYKRVLSIFKLRIFRWLMPLLGALLIISPVPDEIGLTMMGFSKVRTRMMMPLTFIFNYLGILLIAAIAGTL